MLASSELHVIVPGICGPLAEIQSLNSHQGVNKWVQLLSKSKMVTSHASANDVLSEIFSLNTDGDFSSAAFSLLAHNLYDSSKHYMHADPVYLQADMDHAILTSTDDLNVAEYEAVALCDSLNQHFNQDDIAFISLENNQWFIETKDKIEMTTTPLSEAIGRNVNFILPEGKDAMRWKQLLTEAQMLMFSHEVNQNREIRSLQTVNSLWLYGVGGLPVIKAERGSINSLCGDQNMLKGLARHVQCDYYERPESVDEYIKKLSDMASDSVNVLHLTELEHLVNYTDVSLWAEKLSELLEDWVYPLLEMAHKKNINVILYPCNKKQYYFSKHDYLRFWCRGKLEQHVHSYQ
jgi:hypothetical protein